MKIRSLAVLLALHVVLSAAAAGAQEQPARTDLPLSRIVLFTSGVGYFQHDGTVEGDAGVVLTFSVAQVNDLLKSLVLRDLDGGSIRSVTYDSRDPVARTLQSFPIDLTGNPTLSGILTQLRGETVTLIGSERLSGSIIGVEEHVTTYREGAERTVSYNVNLQTAEGIRSVPLDRIQGFRIDNPDIQADLVEALALLASTKEMGRKTVGLRFTGQGRRRVQVGYVLEMPVWKTTYRLVLGPGTEHFLQGWAIVENTTDDDWRDVRLTLVSGRPISFTMDLYEPLYVERPAVELETYGSLRPRLYDMALDQERTGEETAAAMAPRAVPAPSSTQRATTGLARAAEPAPEAFRVDQGVAAAALAGEVGELFQYVIERPVTLPRQQSALLPIVNQSVAGERFSIYNESVHARNPLNALKLRNTTGLSLMQGPITIFDGGVYAGDAQIRDLPAGQDVFLSYAIDLETEVAPAGTGAPEELTAIRVAKGVLAATYKHRKTRTYTISSRSTQARTIMVEHPLSAGWTLAGPGQATETTRDHYRFAVPLPAGASRTLDVIEERVLDQTFALSGLSNDRVDLFFRSPVASVALKEAFRRILALRQLHQEAVTERQRLEARVQEIGRDQQRIRENMGRLGADDDLYKRYVSILGAQEDELATLAEGIASARSLEASRKRELDTYLMTLDVS
jgi:hypothetical protein